MQELKCPKCGSTQIFHHELQEVLRTRAVLEPDDDDPYPVVNDDYDETDGDTINDWFSCGDCGASVEVDKFVFICDLDSVRHPSL